MTLDLDAIIARAAAASPAPWAAITDNGRKNGIGIVGQLSKRGTGEAIAVFAGADSAQRNADAEFTAHVREDVPALLAELSRMRTALTLIAEYADRRNELMVIGFEQVSAIAHRALSNTAPNGSDGVA